MNKTAKISPFGREKFKCFPTINVHPQTMIGILSVTERMFSEADQ